MAIYIHIFDTESAFTEAYNSEAYTEPWTSYTTETDEVNYNKFKCQDVTPVPPHADVVMSTVQQSVEYERAEFTFYGYRMCWDESGESASPIFIWVYRRSPEMNDEYVGSYSGYPTADAWWVFPSSEDSDYPCYFSICGSCPTTINPVESPYAG